MDEQTLTDYLKSEKLTVFIFAYTILFGILLYSRLLGIKEVSLWILTGFFWFPFALYFSFLFFKVSLLKVIGAMRK